jgi:hypothetical protein
VAAGTRRHGMSSVCAAVQRDSARCAGVTAVVGTARSARCRLKGTGGYGVHMMKHRALKVTVEREILKDLLRLAFAAWITLFENDLRSLINTYVISLFD